jgi:small subunit ribosomal protein S9
MVKNYFVKSSRKKAKARCVVKKGVGKITINKTPIDTLFSGYKKEIILEPTNIVPEYFQKLDFSVNVSGGGVSGQIQTIRSCIAKGILEANNHKEEIREKFLNYDRHLIVDDVRQKESKKQLGPGARSKKQQSKR